jgi:ABC-type multidrug transport system fused ATPase/permease subunit
MTVRDASEILVLDRGEVVERGTHGELMLLDAAYARLHRLHQGGTNGAPPAIEPTGVAA